MARLSQLDGFLAAGGGQRRPRDSMEAVTASSVGRLDFAGLSGAQPTPRQGCQVLPVRCPHPTARSGLFHSAPDSTGICARASFPRRRHPGRRPPCGASHRPGSAHGPAPRSFPAMMLSSQSGSLVRRELSSAAGTMLGQRAPPLPGSPCVTAAGLASAAPGPIPPLQKLLSLAQLFASAHGEHGTVLRPLLVVSMAHVLCPLLVVSMAQSFALCSW